jgi:3-oxoacyl-[acyl-carrier-protein] synthase II
MNVSAGRRSAETASDEKKAGGTTVEAVAVLTGWGEGIQALPADAARAAAGRPIIPLGRPALEGERFRRATRECLLGVAAVDALLRDNHVSRDLVRGTSTALLYVTAGAYGASNRAWVAADTARPAGVGDRPGERRRGAVSGTLHFPYTAPSVMSGEVAIEFGLTGPYGILIGGAAATIDALWQATLLLEAGRCQRALVLAVETFEDCAELYARGRWLVGRPLVEAAACALLVPGALHTRYHAPRTASELETRARARAGETLACAPLIALALGREGGATGSIGVTGEWRGRRAGLHWH